MDLLPTLMHVCRIKLDKRSPDHLPIDGVNVWGTLLARNGNILAKTCFTGTARTALRRFVSATGSCSPTPPQAERHRPSAVQPDKDIEEKNDPSSQHPERVKQMQMLAQQRLASIRAKSIPLGQAKAE